METPPTDKNQQPPQPVDPTQPPPNNLSGLRAYFASTALNGLLACGFETAQKNPLQTCRLAWKFADSMIQTQSTEP